MAHIQSTNNDKPLLPDVIENPKNTQQNQGPGLFSDEEIIISEILSVDLDNMTPINALQTISRWKKTLSGQ